MNGFVALLKTLGPGRVLAMGGVAAGLLAFFFYLSSQFSESDLTILNADLEPAQAQAVISRLESQNVPYRLVADGRTVLVPRDQVARLRLEFAGDGLGGALFGYEVFDKGNALGMTSFVQNVNWIRAIEGELVRTIKSFNMVNNARVHVVLPKREILSRQQQKPSASIVIETLGGDLTSGQVAAIVNLVASAVPQLSADDISLMDNKGRVYSRGDGGSVAGGSMMSGLQERQTALEMRLRDEVVQMLERIVGPGKAHVDLAASLNFEKLTQETEVYDPDGQVVKSTQVFEDSENDTEQDAGDQVTVANNLPDAQGAAGGGRTQQSNRNSLQEITNFQNSRTSTMRVRESGELERLTVAVAVDGTYEVNDSGDAVYTARSAEELEQIRRLVQAAIGFDEGRGDQVTVEAMRFAPPEDLAFGDEPGTLLGFAGSDLIALVRVLVLGIVAILGILLVVRPLIIRLLASIPEPQAETTSEEGVAQLPAGVEPMALAPPEDGDDVTAELVALAAEGDEDARLRIEQAQSDGVQIAEKLGIGSEIDIARVEGQVRGSAMAKVGDIINRHPEESAAIVRQWLYSD